MAVGVLVAVGVAAGETALAGVDAVPDGAEGESFLRSQRYAVPLMVAVVVAVPS